MNMENIQKKLETCERAVMESRSRINELESENRQLNQQVLFSDCYLTVLKSLKDFFKLKIKTSN